MSSNWKWPAIPGVEKFKNKLHSAAWDDTVDLSDKVVGMIGNGSSAVQIIPAIFPSKLMSLLQDASKRLNKFFQNRNQEDEMFHEIFDMDHGRLRAEVRG